MNKKYLYLLGMIVLLIVSILASNFLSSKISTAFDKGSNAGVWFALGIPTALVVIVMPFKIVSEII